MALRLRPKQARREVLWVTIWFLGAVFVLDAAMEWRHPEIYDVEHVTRTRMLKERLAEHPDRELCLVMGSSRLAFALQPEKLPPFRNARGQELLVFNFSHLGASPAMHWMELHRLLDEGIRPARVYLELIPTHLSARDDNFVASHAGARDLLVLNSHMQARKLYPKYARRALEQAPRYPAYLLGLEAMPTFPLLPLGGYIGLREEADAKTRKEKTAVTAQLMKDPTARLCISPRPARLLRDCIKLCQQKGATVDVVLMPEGSLFRSWYTPEGEGRLQGYLAELRQLGVNVIDARTWLDDGAFYDEHHVVRRGAEKFTRLFGERVLAPLAGEGESVARAKGSGR
jgi:hypothetical protein